MHISDFLKPIIIIYLTALNTIFHKNFLFFCLGDRGVGASKALVEFFHRKNIRFFRIRFSKVLYISFFIPFVLFRNTFFDLISIVCLLFGLFLLYYRFLLLFLYCFVLFILLYTILSEFYRWLFNTVFCCFIFVFLFLHLILYYFTFYCFILFLFWFFFLFLLFFLFRFFFGFCL